MQAKLMGQVDQNTQNLDEVLFEFIPNGNYVKVVAVDPVTNTEIILVGDRRSGKQMLQKAAVQKLEYVIAKGRKLS